MVLSFQEYQARDSPHRHTDGDRSSILEEERKYQPSLALSRRFEGQPCFRSDVELTPNRYDPYSNDSGRILHHNKSDILYYRRKPRLVPSCPTYSELRNNDYTTVSKLGGETRGIYCGILGEYARESGEFQRPLHHVDQSNSEHQHERIQNSYTHSQDNPDTSWKFRQKGMCFHFVNQFWKLQLSIFFTLV